MDVCCVSGVLAWTYVMCQVFWHGCVLCVWCSGMDVCQVFWHGRMLCVRCSGIDVCCVSGVLACMYVVCQVL